MRIVYNISLVTGFLCLALAAVAFIQVPIQKVKTTAALSVIEAALAGTGPARRELPENLRHAISDIRGNDSTYRATHSVLWPLATYGFALVAMLQFLVAYLLRPARRLKLPGFSPGEV